MLTLREKATYEFIQYYIDTNKHSPTAAEIAEHLKIQSRGVVHRYIKALSDKGYITLVKGKWRNIELKQHPLATSIPILGAIAAGQPIEVTFTYDKSGRMNCEFIDITTGDKQILELRPDSSLNPEDAELDFKIE